jgi:hypothetical protein
VKKALVIFWIMSLFVQTGSTLWILISFEANREYIAEALCINKSKPKMACAGSCHLAKQLNAEKKRQSQVPEHLKKKEELICRFDEVMVCEPHADAGAILRKADFFYSSLYHFTFTVPSWKPPQHIS